MNPRPSHSDAPHRPHKQKMRPANIASPHLSSNRYLIASLLRFFRIKKFQQFSSATPSSLASMAATASLALPDSASQPSPASPALPFARYIGKEFPSGTAYFGRAALDAVPGRSTCQN